MKPADIENSKHPARRTVAIWPAVVCVVAIVVLGWQYVRLLRPSVPKQLNPHPPENRRGEHDGGHDYQSATVRLNAGAATLAAAVLADSAIEHYRGGFYRPAMYVAPLASALTCGAALAAARNQAAGRWARVAVFGIATATGVVGSWFHLANIFKRGGWRWTNVFYGAPAAAPLALHVAGLLGLTAEELSRSSRLPPKFAMRHAPATAGLLAAAGLVGTSADAWLFHFRGAFQNPFMHVPVGLPPLAAAALSVAVVRGGARWTGMAVVLLRATALVGIAGVGFHAYGVQRRMGGWRNWTQNLWRRTARH